jgi:peptidoglycan-associated lipoprotein|tara:strand:+ start:87 stop:551 length:465 start_codon:yes stop_codon:yes gene_type:complete
MTLTNKIILFTFSIVIAACSTVSTERTNDTTAISASSSSVFSDQGIKSNNILYFEYDKADINSAGRAKIRNMAGIINKNDLSVRIEGHCDERGTREYNLALGEKRAKIVSELLVINGVSSSKITTVSYGEEKPASSGSNEKSWSKNRRALIKTF